MRMIKPEIAEARIKRARVWVGAKIAYRLGRGGFNINNPNNAAWDKRRCDCTGWASYILMMRRDQVNAKKPWSKFLTWIETTILWNCIRKGVGPFKMLAKPEAGCFAVYPDSIKGQGHITLITKVEFSLGGFWDIDGIDCSSGSYRRYGDAILERDVSFFLNNPKTIYFCLATDLI